VDWHDLAAESLDGIVIHGQRVPFAVFDNHDDVTTRLGPVFEARLEAALAALWERWRAGRAG